MMDKRKAKQHFFQGKKDPPFTILFISENLSLSSFHVMNDLIEACVSLENITPLFLGEFPQFGKKFHVFSKQKKEQAFLLADIIVYFPSQISKSVSSLLKMLSLGIVPIAPITKKTKAFLSAYDPLAETGNCFLYNKGDVWNILEAIIRAKETYRFPYDWENLIRLCKKI